jgi:hypothetical protein
MYWLLGRKSKLSINNELLIYKTILKPVWAHGIQLWGTASTSNIEIIVIVIVNIVFLRFSLLVSLPKSEEDSDPIQYRRVLMNALPHAFVRDFTFADCTGTDCK